MTTAVAVAALVFLLIRLVASVAAVGIQRVFSAATDEIEVLGKRMDDLHIEMRNIHQNLE